MIQYKIESGIEAPQTDNRGGKYPFKLMAVGDSFFVPGSAENINRVALRVANAAHYAAKRYGFRFTTRRNADGVRVWRVE